MTNLPDPADLPRFLMLGSAPTVGDAGIGLAIIQQLRRRWPGCSITLATGTIDAYRELADAHDITLVKKPNLFGKSGRGLKFLRRLRDASGGRVAFARGYDAVVYQGGPQWNDVWLDASKLKRRLLEFVAARAEGVPTVLWGQSFGPFAWSGVRGMVLRQITRAALNRATIVSPRDRFSVPALSRLKLGGPTIVPAADAAFRLEAASAEVGERVLRDAGVATDRPLIGLCLRDFQERYGMADTDRAWTAFARVVDGVADDLGHVVYLSTDYRDGAGAELSDLDVIREIQRRRRRTDGITIIDKVLAPDVVAAAYGRMAALVAGRLHPAIFALGQATPTMIVSYTAKCDDVAERMGLSAYRTTYSGFDPDDAMAKLRRLLDANPRREIAERLAALAAEADKTIEALAAVLAAKGRA